MNLVLEGRIQRSRSTMRRWQAAQIGMKLLSSAAVIGGTAGGGPIGPAVGAVVGTVSSVVDSLAADAASAAEIKRGILDVIVTLLSGVLKMNPEKEQMRAVVSAIKNAADDKNGNAAPVPEESKTDFDLPQKDYVTGPCTLEVTSILDLLR